MGNEFGSRNRHYRMHVHLSGPAPASQGRTSRCLLAEFHNISSGFLQSYGHDVPVGPVSSVSHGADGLAWVEVVVPGSSFYCSKPLILLTGGES